MHRCACLVASSSCRRCGNREPSASLPIGLNEAMVSSCRALVREYSGDLTPATSMGVVEASIHDPESSSPIEVFSSAD